MKKALLLFAALLVAGCGEKSSPEGSESTGEKPTPSNDTVQQSDDAKPTIETAYKDGRKLKERTLKDGKEISVKYWNSKGEEVDSLTEALK